MIRQHAFRPRTSLAAMVLALPLLGLAGCSADYSPDTYSSNAVQQANKVETGVVVGYREVKISASGTVGAVAGGAVGGVLGAQMTGDAALGTAVGGTVIGTLVGNSIEHATSDTTGWEYIVRKPNGDMLSVTQREPKPLPIGQHVLVITGNQARVIADYSVPVEQAAKTTPADVKTAGTDAGADKTAAKDLKDKAVAAKAVPDAPVAGIPATATPASTPASLAPAAPVPPPAATQAGESTPAPTTAAASQPDDTPTPPPAKPANATAELPANAAAPMDAISALIDSLHVGETQATGAGTPN